MPRVVKLSLPVSAYHGEKVFDSMKRHYGTIKSLGYLPNPMNSSDEVNRRVSDLVKACAQAQIVYQEVIEFD